MVRFPDRSLYIRMHIALRLCFFATVLIGPAFSTPSNAQSCGGAGLLDTSFDFDGIVTTPFVNSTAVTSMVIQSDGKIVAVGPTDAGALSDFAVVRYNSNGSLDGTFGANGKVITDVGNRDNQPASVSLQSDGKIVVAGYSFNGATPGTNYDITVIRYNPDGSLDLTFGTGGSVSTHLGSNEYGSSVAIQSDGKIVVAGRGYNFSTFLIEFAVVRYNADGSLDTSFGGGGYVQTRLGFDDRALSVALQPDNKIVAAGFTYRESSGPDADFAVVRYNADGSMDTSFGSDGRVITSFGGGLDIGRSVRIQSDGRIVVAGIARNTNDDFAVARYNPNGSLDTSFGAGGTVTTAFASSSGNDRANSVSIQSDGKLVVAGSSYNSNIGLARYSPDGSLDRSFGMGGLVTSFNEQFFLGSASSAAIQTDGKIVTAGGSFDFEIARFNAVCSSTSPSPTPTNTPTATPTATPSATQTATATPTPTVTVAFDYDGDGRTDISVFRPSGGAWYLQESAAGFLGMLFGSNTDKIVPADYDGDGKTDIAVFRPSDQTWYIGNSSNSLYRAVVFGSANDLPAPADYDGDGQADICVFRPSDGTWYLQRSMDGAFVVYQFGAAGDKPTVGDFDGDGKSDFAVFRTTNGEWYQAYSSDGSLHGERFGITTDNLAYADYDGDGRTDLAVFRAADRIFYIRKSETATYDAYVFGIEEDIPTPGDYDGDGRADLSVFRPSDGNWYRLNSSNGAFNAFQFGLSGDRPTPGAYQ